MQKLVLFLLGAVVVFVALTGLRLFRSTPKQTHYHPNFALFIDDQRVDFSGDRYMEPVAACSLDGEALIKPEQRVHLHNNNPDVVHVHDQGVTWGHLLVNLGFNVGDRYLVDDRGTIYHNNSEKQLRFILNNRIVPSIANRLIEAHDKLLIDYGSTPTEALIGERFANFPSNAADFDGMPDPGNCSGSVPLTFSERLKQAVVG